MRELVWLYLQRIHDDDYHFLAYGFLHKSIIKLINTYFITYNNNEAYRCFIVVVNKKNMTRARANLTV